MEQYIQSVVTILALVNPVVCAAIFANCVHTLPRKQKVRQALTATAAVGVVLLASAFFGTRILNTFGISLPAFTCAGGAILAWIGAGMLRPGDDGGGAGKPGQDAKVSLSPLILFAASPGTITAVITIAAAHNKGGLPVTAIFGVGVALAVLAGTLLLSVAFSKGGSEKGDMRKMVSSYMGVIVIAMGIQFMLTGVRGFLQ